MTATTAARKRTTKASTLPPAPTTGIKSVDTLVAVEAAKGVEIKYLGNLAWSTITDCAVTLDQLKAAFAESGIDEKLLPLAINARDAFRRALKTAEVRREPLDDPKTTKAEEMRYLNLLPRQVRMDKDKIVVQLVREIVDQKDVRLSYEPIVEYTLEGDLLHIKQMVPIDKAMWDRSLALDTEYKRCRTEYDGIRMRSIVTKVIETCKPVSVRPSGGVYFIPATYEPTLKSLQKFVEIVTKYGTTSMRSVVRAIPVVDAAEQRTMVEESLEEQVEGDSQALIEEMAEVLKAGKKITTTVAMKFITRVRDLGDLTKEYEEMLSVQSTKAASAIEVARQQAQALLASVTED